jgi:hypothetical protein
VWTQFLVQVLLQLARPVVRPNLFIIPKNLNGVKDSGGLDFSLPVILYYECKKAARYAIALLAGVQKLLAKYKEECEMKKSALLLNVILALGSATASGQDTLWTRTYGGVEADIGYSVQQTTDGGYIIVGETRSFGAGATDIYLVKTDSNADTLWTRTIGGTGYDMGYSVEQTSDGGYIVAGVTTSFGAGRRDVYLVKTGANGDTSWAETYGGRNDDSGSLVRQTMDGEYVIVGTTYSFGSGGADVYFLRVAANGDTVWTKTYGGTDSEAGWWFQKTSDGGYIIVGQTMSFGSGDKDVYLIKTDQDGEPLWTRAYGGRADDRGFWVGQTPDEGYLITGWTMSFGAGGQDIYIIKTDANGDTLWTLTHGGSGDDVGKSVLLTPDGGYLVAGYTSSFGQGGFDVYLIRVAANGDSLWAATYGGPDDDAANSLQATTDGGHIVAGSTASFGHGNDDFYLIKGITIPVLLDCRALTPIFCRGKHFYFKLSLTNNSGSYVSGTLTFSAYAGYDCDPTNVLVNIPRARSYPPGVTERYYLFKVPNVANPGQYSASVAGTLNDVELFCCMNTDIIQCSPFRGEEIIEWQLAEVERAEMALPTTTELYQNYPNPFNVSTSISYSLARPGEVCLNLYDLSGHLVATLFEGYQEAGEHLVSWEAIGVSSGTYFYRLTADDYTATRRMILLK